MYLRGFRIAVWVGGVRDREERQRGGCLISKFIDLRWRTVFVSCLRTGRFYAPAETVDRGRGRGGAFDGGGGVDCGVGVAEGARGGGGCRGGSGYARGADG